MGIAVGGEEREGRMGGQPINCHYHRVVDNYREKSGRERNSGSLEYDHGEDVRE